MKKFVIMVDNEVVDLVQYPEEGDNVSEDVWSQFVKPIAVLSSDPRFMVVNETVEVGSIWDGTTFNPPTV